MSDPPFPIDPGPIGTTRDGRPIAMCAMTPQAAAALGPAMADIDPWARLGVEAALFTSFLARHEAGAYRYRIVVDDIDAGICVVRDPWLSGPYLNLLGLVPQAQRQGVGKAVLQWLEARARTAKHRNLWLCVSSFNDNARRIYERAGYTHLATIDSLSFDGFDEHLMRKRLLSSPP